MLRAIADAPETDPDGDKKKRGNPGGGNPEPLARACRGARIFAPVTCSQARTERRGRGVVLDVAAYGGLHRPQVRMVRPATRASLQVLLDRQRVPQGELGVQVAMEE